MNIAWYLGAFLIAIGLLVVVHELGHFVAARSCGVKVLRFCVGFGKPLASWHVGKDRTEFTIAAFPLGGYVKMLDEREAPVSGAELHRAFNRQSVWRKMLIVVAGPISNLVLAVVLYWGMFLHGIQDLPPILGEPARQTIASNAGIVAGERVSAVDGRPVATWSELRIELLDSLMEDSAATLETVNPRGEIAFHRLALDKPGALDLGDDPARMVGLRPKRPTMPPVVGSVVDRSRAQSAGLMVGDWIVEIDGDAIGEWEQVVDRIRNAPDRELALTIKRDASILHLHVTPERVNEGGREIGRIGVGVRVAGQPDALVDVSYPLGMALRKACGETWRTAVLSLRMIAKMITGDISWHNLSGPVAIADYAGQSARLGLAPYLNFLALISVSVGILNLLPVPVLDGGHLLYYLAEFVKGSPVSEKAQSIGQYLGFAILGLLMAFALFNDIHRLIPG